jgi:hypothetical protein
MHSLDVAAAAAAAAAVAAAARALPAQVRHRVRRDLQRRRDDTVRRVPQRLENDFKEAREGHRVRRRLAPSRVSRRTFRRRRAHDGTAATAASAGAAAAAVRKMRVTTTI